MATAKWLERGIFCLLLAAAPCAAQDTTAPSVPQNVSAPTVGYTTLTLTWSASTDNVGVTGYEVFQNGVSLGTAAGTSRNVAGLTANTLYQFTVRARDAANNWSAQSLVTAVRTWQALTVSPSSGYIDSWDNYDEENNYTGTDYSWNNHGFALPGVGTIRAIISGANVQVALPWGTQLNAGSSYLYVYGPDTGAYDIYVDYKLRGVPVASFTTTPASGRAPLAVNFDASGSTNVNGYIAAYTWDLDNNGTTDASGVTASRSYPNTGSSALTYTAKLTLSDFESGLSITTRTITVYPQGSFGVVVSSGMTSLPYQMPGSTVTLTASAPTAGQQFSHWTIVSGNGTFNNVNSSITTFTVGSADTVVQANYASDTTAPSVPQNVSAPTVGYTTLTLTWSASTDNVGVTGYEVFQNGVSLGTAAGTSRNVAGLTANTLYQFTVRARDAANNWSAQSLVTAVRTWQALTVSPSSGYIDSWDNYDEENNYTGTDYSWNNHGFALPGVGTIRAIISGANVQVALPWGTQLNAGSSYLYVYGPDTGAYDIYVDYKLRGVPVASFTTTPASGRAPLAVNFDASGSTNVNGYIAAYTWDLDNNGTTDASGVTASRSYPNTGSSALTYTAKLTLSDFESGLSITTRTITVYPQGSYRVAVNGGTTDLPYQMPGSTVILTASAPVAGQQFDHWAIVSGSGSFTNANSATTTLTVGTADTVVQAYYVSDVTSPTMPQNVSVPTVGYTTLTLTWSASTDNVGVTGYEVFQNGVSLGTAAGTSRNVAGLTANTLYQFTVRARDAANNWSAQSLVTAVRTWQALTVSPSSGYIDSWDNYDEENNYTGTDYSWNNHWYTASGTGIVRYYTSGANVQSGGATAVSNGSNYVWVTGPDTGDYAIYVDFKTSSSPTIISQPSNAAVAPGNTSSFSVSASGEPSPGYQWQRKPAGQPTFVNLASDAAFSGVATATLNVLGTTAAMNGDQFRCVVSNSLGSVASSPATLAVSAPTLVILGGNNQSTIAGQFNSQPFDIAVWNSGGTLPFVNSPVTFTVQSGGGQLATVNTGSPALSTTLTLNTDIDGTVRAFYRQPSAAGVNSQILVASNGLQVTLGSQSVAAPPPSSPTLIQTVSTTPSSVTLAWAPSTPGSGGLPLAGYNIYRGSEKLNGVPVLSTGYIDTSVTAGTIYSYSVAAVDSGGNESSVTLLTIAVPSSSTNGSFEVFSPLQ